MGSVALPFVGMMMAECAQVGLMIVAKAAMTRGMSNLVFIFYSNAFASLILLPTSFLFHRYSLSLSLSLGMTIDNENKNHFFLWLHNIGRSTDRPPLSFPILCGFFVLSLLG
jgi:hypothetical protein